MESLVSMSVTDSNPQPLDYQSRSVQVSIRRDLLMAAGLLMLAVACIVAAWMHEGLFVRMIEGRGRTPLTSVFAFAVADGVAAFVCLAGCVVSLPRALSPRYAVPARFVAAVAAAILIGSGYAFLRFMVISIY
jgi:hypothetical protein